MSINSSANLVFSMNKAKFVTELYYMCDVNLEMCLECVLRKRMYGCNV